MKDINFDELDKAVNSVLEATGNKPDVPDANQVSDKPANAPASPTSAADDKPASDDKPTEATVDVPAKPAASSPVDKGRRSGRFMDVVHPSVAKKPQLMSRSGKDVKPLSGDVKPEELPVQPAAPATQGEQAKPVENTPAPESPVASIGEPDAAEPAKEPTPPAAPAPAPGNDGQNWPDPLDVHGFKYDEKDSEPNKGDDKADIEDGDVPPMAETTEVTEAEQPAAENKPAAEESSTTPFIADAKVEKRPLGAFATGEADDNAKATEEPGKTAPPEDLQQPAKVPTQVEKLPPELDKDVLAVEAGEFSSHDSKKPEEAENKPEEDESDSANQARLSGQNGQAGPTLSAAASIPQQYKEQPAESQAGKEDQTHHGFNKDYHDTPLLEPSHHGSKHAVLWIALAIIILLATGAYFAWWYLVATA
jgi:hypothetical protein